MALKERGTKHNKKREKRKERVQTSEKMSVDGY